MFSCGDGDDEAPKNQFTVEGESYELSHGFTYQSEAGVDDDGNEIYAHVVYLTGEDINVNDGVVVEGNDDIVAFSLVSSSEDNIEEGTYEFKDDEVAGTIGQLLIYTDYKDPDDQPLSYDRIFGGAKGTIKVSKSGDKYTFNISIEEFITQNEEGDTEDGEGSIKGYFKGELEEISNDAPSRKAEDFKNPLSDMFNL